MKTETKVKQIMIILDLKQFKGALLVKRDSHVKGEIANWWILPSGGFFLSGQYNQ